MGFFKKLFCRKKKETDSTSVEEMELQYYISLDNEVYGPFSLLELRNDYGKYLTKDTLITADALNGEWYEARYFECFDELFNPQQDFRINEFGEIVRKKSKNR